MTERQAVIKHFVDKDRKFKNTVDLAVYLRADQVGDNVLKDQKGYVDRVLESGYTSKMTNDLMNDINGAVENGSQAAQPSEVDEEPEGE